MGNNEAFEFEPKQMNVKLTFVEELLGGLPNNPDIYRDYVASKAENAETIEEEVAAMGVKEFVDRERTVFVRDEEGRPCLYDYHVKGFFKDSCGMLRRVKGSRSSKLTAYKKVIDGLIFPQERLIPLEFEGKVGHCARPLRAQTAQGDRVALADSETVPKGTTCRFTLTLFDPKLEPLVKEWLAYGSLHGFGQWRNASKGRFLYEVEA